MRLWEKGLPVNEKALRFTAGDDPELDLHLVPYDCRASMAHARMLGRIGVLQPEEVTALCAALEEIIELAAAGKFSIRPEEEDCHTAIENVLTEKLGDVGEKIHTGRSRNDQVLTALRLYYRDHLAAVEQLLNAFCAALEEFIEKNGTIPLPGFTHTRKAMPTTVGVWAGAYRAAMEDDRAVLQAAARLVNQSPAGSGAGFGVPLELDRNFVARELGFDRVQENPLSVQNSRGKFEAALLHALSMILLDLNKFATDLILFSLPEFGYFQLADELTTGSSIMPHKRNPDVLEILRASYHRMLALEFELGSLAANLISGYHRDLQFTKRAAMEGFALCEKCLEMAALVVQGLSVDEAACRRALTPELFATAEVYELVKKGLPFREAYRRVAAKWAGKKRREKKKGPSQIE